LHCKKVYPISFLVLAAVLTTLCIAQTSSARVITGGMNAEFTVADQESSIAFYQNVLGLGAPIARINPPAAAVGKLTGTVTGAAHVARMPIPGASWTIVKGGVKIDHWGGEKVDHLTGGRGRSLKDLRERKPPS
jgi:hypothetical protein